MEKNKTEDDRIALFGLIFIFGILLVAFVLAAGVNTVNLISPSNNSWTMGTNNTVPFVFNYSGDNATASCELFVNNIGFGINSSVLGNVSTTLYANNTLNYGADKWYVNCSNGTSSVVSNTRTLNVFSSNSFNSTWDTSKTSTGSSNATAIALPLESNGVYNFAVYWGDGTSDLITSYNQAEVTHNYATAGIYNVSIYGIIKGFGFNNGGDKSKILDISNWGSLNVGNDGYYFYGASNLKLTATDALNLTGTTDLSHMFASFFTTFLFNGDLSSWNVSKVTNMDWMFEGATSFNGNISNWDTSSVTNMSHIFDGATSFNHPLNNWNVSSVTDMDFMFSDAASFNQPLNSWDVSKVKYMGWMFLGAASFNQPLNNWNVSSVRDMHWMFSDAASFNQPLTDWDVSNVNSMWEMFGGATSFNQPLTNWNISSVADSWGMFEMFAGATSFNQNLSSWDFSSIKNMKWMFSDATSFNGNISDWNVSSVTNMGLMFEGATSFNQPLNNWNVSSVRSMHGMFQQATSFNQNLSSWDTSSVTDMSYMFTSGGSMSLSFNGNISDWNTSSVTDMSFMFDGDPAFNQNINSWEVSKVTDMNNMFDSATSFNQSLNNWNVSKVTNMQGMFYSATSFNGNISDWDVSKVKDMSGMFSGVKLSIPNYNSLLIGWDSLPSLQSGVIFSGGNSNYCSGGTARQDLINKYNWTITDGGVSPICPDYTPPTYSDSKVDITAAGHFVKFSLLVNDNIFLNSSGQYIFSTNNTGVWVNDSSVNFTSTPDLISTFKKLNSTVGLTIGYRWYLTDNQRNKNQTGISTLTTTSMPLFLNDVPFKSTWDTSKTSEGSSLLSNRPSSSNATQIRLPLTSDGIYNFTVDWGDGSNESYIGSYDSPEAIHNYASKGIYNVSIYGIIKGFRFYGGGDRLKIKDISQWGDLNVGNDGGYFLTCRNLNLTATDSLNLTGTTDLSGMFSFATSFNGNISDWDVSKVTNMGWMFEGDPAFNQNLSSWNVSKVKSMAYLFADATSFNGNISDWDTSSVTDVDRMFEGATSFNQPLNNWNVSKVTNMQSMFSRATSFNQPLNNWDVSSVIGLNGMFGDATSFNQNLSSWNVSFIYYMDEMFFGAKLSTANYDSLLIGWDSLPSLRSKISFDGGNSQYCLGVSARQDLINKYKWNIVDGGKNCSGSSTVTTNPSGSSGSGGGSSSSSGGSTSGSGSSTSGGGSLIYKMGGGNGANSAIQTIHKKILQSSLENGYSKRMYNNWKISFKVGDESHLFKVLNVTNSTAEIILSSTPQQATFFVGQEKKFNLNGNDYYDVLVKLNSIDTAGGNGANFTIQTIHEKILSSSGGNETATNETNKTAQNNSGTGARRGKGSNLTWLWVLIGIVLLLILFGIGYKKKYFVK